MPVCSVYKRGITQIDEELRSSESGLSSVELVSWLVSCI